jgi:hypothetical protein
MRRFDSFRPSQTQRQADMAEEESGIDELMRLSRQFTKQQEDHARQ